MWWLRPFSSAAARRNCCAESSGVTDRQMAETIAENLKDFRYSYESRRAEIESEKRIEDALKKLPDIRKKIKEETEP